MIAAVVAVDAHTNGIGFQGQLLERIPDDMLHFAKLTFGHSVIMGRKTYDSLPTRPLPGRKNYVITRRKPSKKSTNPKYISLWMAKLYLLLHKLPLHKKSKIFIIGGGEIYSQLLPYCDEIYMTKIFCSHKTADVFFPNLNEKDWEKKITGLGSYNNILYQYLHYSRKS